MNLNYEDIQYENIQEKSTPLPYDKMNKKPIVKSQHLQWRTGGRL